ncbi:MAG: carbohydrate ABC transporter permease [Nakamurella sp.]
MTLSSSLSTSGRTGRRKRSHVAASGERYASVWLHLAALVAIIVFLAPFAWLAIASVTTRGALLEKPLHWIPQQLDFSRWKDIFTGDAATPAGGFRSAMVNSAIVALGTVTLSIVVAVLGAYAVSRLKFRGRGLTLLAFLATYMIPPIAIVIPLYLVLVNLGLLDSKLGLILVYSSFITPFVLWTLTNFFDALPREIDEAASIDGAGRMRILWQVLLPLAKPGLFSAILFATMLCWDEFLYALIFTSTPASKTIPVAVAEFSGKFATDFGLLSAGGLLAAIPPVIVALVFQRYVTAGLAAGSVKG